jgi:predicted nucleic acid-binding Zn ribbon protein
MLNPSRTIPPLGPPRPDARRRALAAWRGQDISPLEAIAARSAKPLSEIMPKVLSDLRLERRRAEAEIIRVWNHLIDPTLTAHAQPTGLNKGTLFVTVDSTVWRDEIVRYRRKEILDRLQHAFGRETIARISFRLGG